MNMNISSLHLLPVHGATIILLLVSRWMLSMGDDFSFSMVAYEGSTILNYSCDTSAHPQPTYEYPGVLFEDLNFNGCDAASKKYERMRANDFHMWNKNRPKDQARLLRWRSMLVLPNSSVTFRACCPSGNDWKVSVNNWNSTPNMNQSVFYHEELQGNQGVWYRLWLYWEMVFDVRVDPPVNKTWIIPTCSGACYYGQCGVSGRCECAPGYSGEDCGTAPNADAWFPTQTQPLVLFTEVEFNGTVKRFNADEAVVFATNAGNARVMQYKSMRVLHNRTVSFLRNDYVTNNYANMWSPGSNVRDLEKFFESNVRLTTNNWYNYERSIDSSFYVRVESNVACDGCHATGGCCYTGVCACKPGFTGVNCSTSN